LGNWNTRKFTQIPRKTFDCLRQRYYIG